MSVDGSVDQRENRSVPTARSGGWHGMVVFAATMMIMLGTFHAIAGLVAIFEPEYYLVGKHGLVVSADFTVWGWVHLILGALVAFAGCALFAGQAWARVVAIAVAMVSAVVNLGFLSAYPLWSAIMITVDVLVIYAVTAQGAVEDQW